MLVICAHTYNTYLVGNGTACLTSGLPVQGQVWGASSSTFGRATCLVPCEMRYFLSICKKAGHRSKLPGWVKCWVFGSLLLWYGLGRPVSPPVTLHCLVMNLHGESRGTPCHGQPVGNSRAIHGQPMGNPWTTHRKPMSNPRTDHGQPVVNPWATHGQVTGNP